MSNDIKANVYLLREIESLVTLEEETFGTRKRVVNAAIWMFSQASAEEKVKAIKRIASMERGPVAPTVPVHRPSPAQQSAIEDEQIVAEFAQLKKSSSRRKRGA